MRFLQVVSVGFVMLVSSIVDASPVFDIVVSDNGDTTYTYDVSVTNNNSGTLYFFGVDISHITYDPNGWNDYYMSGTWSNSYYGGASDPFSTAWLSNGVGFATGVTETGFSFTSYDYVELTRVFAWSLDMTGLEDTNLNDGASSYGWEFETSVSVSAVPVPAAVWLFGSGLIALAGFAKRKTA